MRYPIQEIPFYSYPQILIPINHTPTFQTNNQQLPISYFNPGVFTYPQYYGCNQMPIVSHPNRSMTFPIKSSNSKTPNQKKSIKNDRTYVSPLEEEKYIEKKIKKDFSSLTTLSSSPEAEDSSSSNQESKKEISFFECKIRKTIQKASQSKKEEEVKKLMEIIDEKPNLVKYINTIKGSKKLQVLIESELDNSLTLNYLFSKIQLDIGKITNHPFGNYFFQKLIEKTSYSTRKKIWDFFFSRRIEDYTLNQYGHFAFLSLLKATSSEEEEIYVSSSLKRSYSILAYYPTGSFIIQTAFDSFKGKGREDLIDFVL